MSCSLRPLVRRCLAMYGPQCKIWRVMAGIDEEREFRLRPPKPHIPRNEGARGLTDFGCLCTMPNQPKSGYRAPGGKGKGTRPYYQRVAIRVTYMRTKLGGNGRHTVGIWRVRAHSKKTAKVAGFNREKEGVDIAGNLRVGKPRAIQDVEDHLSPEFGDQVDLSRLTRDLITQMEKDLGTRLEWAAAEHYNTEHPHLMW